MKVDLENDTCRRLETCRDRISDELVQRRRVYSVALAYDEWRMLIDDLKRNGMTIGDKIEANLRAEHTTGAARTEGENG